VSCNPGTGSTARLRSQRGPGSSLDALAASVAELGGRVLASGGRSARARRRRQVGHPGHRWSGVGWDTGRTRQRNRRKIKRRIDVVAWSQSGFPDPEALLRLAGAVLVETHDERQVTDRRYLSEGSMATLAKPTIREVAPKQLLPARSRGRVHALPFHHSVGRHQQPPRRPLPSGAEWPS
jgi:hypothetical protein